MKNNFKEIRIVVFLPTLFGGGAEETFIRLVSYLNDNDYDTTLLIGTSNTSSIYEKEIGNRVKVIESPRLRYSILKIFKYLKNAKPDLVISTLWYANIMIFLICKLSTEIFLNSQHTNSNPHGLFTTKFLYESSS